MPPITACCVSRCTDADVINHWLFSVIKNNDATLILIVSTDDCALDQRCPSHPSLTSYLCDGTSVSLPAVGQSCLDFACVMHRSRGTRCLRNRNTGPHVHCPDIAELIWMGSDGVLIQLIRVSSPLFVFHQCVYDIYMSVEIRAAAAAKPHCRIYKGLPISLDSLNVPLPTFTRQDTQHYQDSTQPIAERSNDLRRTSRSLAAIHILPFSTPSEDACKSA